MIEEVIESSCCDKVRVFLFSLSLYSILLDAITDDADVKGGN